MQSSLNKHFATTVTGKLRRHAVILFSTWTVLIAGSVLWNVYQIRNDTIEKARIEARTILEHNLAYRRWNARYGGVYVPVGEVVRPNPYIVSPRRDLTATDGTSLTLVNPFQMTKQTYALLQEQSPLVAVNRTVSLNPMNPENRPDPWEEKWLREFEKGAREVSEITSINGSPYVRVLQPYVTYEGCLQCHALQGYRVGDIRGGMSIAVPIEPYLAAEAVTRRSLLGTHGVIWLAGMAGIAVLVRGIRRQQLQTAASEWKFRVLSDNSQDWQYWITEDQRIVHMTPSCERITGYSAQEFERTPSLVYDIIHPEDRPAYERHMREDVTRPEHEEIDFRVITKSGKVKRIFHVCGPIYHEGSLLGRHVSNRDVTDRRQLEEQLLQAQKMESLGIFAGGIAHDFNNILTVITGYASMLQKTLAGAEESVRKQLQDVVTASLKARSLISSLLSFGRKQVMRRSTVSLNGIIGNIAKILKRIIGEDIELRIHCSAVEFLVHADMHQLEQVIMNLMTNARDAMPRGGAIVIATEPLVIDALSAERFGVATGKYMLLSVRDEGTGIDRNDLDHIFEPFFTTKDTGKGTGLGLAMVYGIVKQHEGFIQVDSEKGSGTRVRIYLPAARQVDAGQERGAFASDAAVRGTETVLLAEDDDMVCGFLQEILQANGYTVIAVADGESAVREILDGNGRIDAAVIDLVLPRRNGWDVYEEARRSSADFRAIFMSGYGPEELAARGLTHDGMTVIQKPIDIEKFLLALRALFTA
jgi:PAS domain S-box-containing protein